MDFLNISKIAKSYNKEVFKNLNLHFNLNEFVFIVGPSGCGKTTLLNCIGLNENVDEGKIFINGKCANNKNKQNLKFNYFSYVFQNDFLIPYLSIKDNLLLTNKAKSNESFERLINELNIDSLLTKKIENLSGGEKQKISVCRCLLNLPKIIIADEPTASLDKENSFKIMDILKQNSEGKLIIVATHDLELANKYGTKILYLDNGEIIEKKLNDESYKINTAENNIPYKQKSILNIIKSYIKFLKYHIKYPLLLTLIFSLCFTLIMSAIGLLNGLKSFTNQEIKNRPDSNYYEFSKMESGEIINCDNLSFSFKLNNLKYTKLNNYNYLFNYFLKDQINNQNNITFDYDYSIIDFKYLNYSGLEINKKPTCIVNNLFKKNYLNDSIKYTGNFSFLDASQNLKFSFDVSVANNETKIYNTPKIYLDYECVESLFDNELIDYIFNTQNKIVIPSYFYFVNSVESINSLLESKSLFYSYLSTDENKDGIIYSSSNLILTKGLSEIINSFSYILIIIIVILLFSIISLFTLTSSYLIKKRDKENALKLAYGYKYSDIKIQIFIETIFIIFISFLISVILFYLIHVIFLNVSKDLLESNLSFDLIEFETISICTGLYISLISSLICSATTSKYLFKTNIMEVLKNE